MKFISWNVNGLRAAHTKGFDDFFKEIDADAFCIQETKLQPDQFDLNFAGYKVYLNSAEKKGYSGTAIYTKNEPINVTYGIGIPEHDNEGRVITMEFDKFYLVNCYTPNSQRGLLRLDYRMTWETDFQKYLADLDKVKPVVMCGDLNVAHEEIDLKNPKSNTKNAGFTIEERTRFGELLDKGFVDTYRSLYPDKIGYTWWSYMRNARENDIGWRIDYFVVSERIADKIKDASIHKDILGSDHCPIELDIDF